VDEPFESRLTLGQAYETAYRFMWQYYQREPSLESLALLLVSMEPVDDQGKTSDPASWPDWQRCVADTIAGTPIPRFPT
jgi:hypothetical protein